jgi:hypothetical protein
MTAYPDPTMFLPMTRALRMRLEATIDQLVALLDAIDSDPDPESESGEMKAVQDDDRFSRETPTVTR